MKLSPQRASVFQFNQSSSVVMQSQRASAKHSALRFILKETRNKQVTVQRYYQPFNAKIHCTYSLNDELNALMLYVIQCRHTFIE